jgi:UDP-N-acetylmuramyl tripeptide synthase
MIANVLAATASYLWGFKTEDISLSLQTFIPSAAQTPGRMNIFEFKKFKVLIDFAHNALVMQVSKTICKVCKQPKIELLLVLVTVVMKILKNVQNCRTHV